MQEELLDDHQQTNLKFHYNLKTLSNIALAFTGITIVIILLRIFAILKFQSLFGLVKTDYTKYSDLVVYGNWVDQLSIWVVVFSVLSWIPFFMWLYRAYYNLDVVKQRGLNVTAGWAVGWFFIPFANLYYSVLVINDLFRGTKHLQSGGSVKESIENTPKVPYGIIWILMRVSGGLLAYLGLYRVAKGNVAVFDEACFYEVLANSLDAVSGIIIMLLVFQVTRGQTAISNSEIKE